MTSRHGAGLRRIFQLASAGQLDAGLASIASLIVQVYSLRVMTAAEFGAYGLAFSAMLLLAQIPANLVHGPFEVSAVDLDTRMRVGVLRASLRPGMVVALLVSPAVILGVAPAATTVPREFLGPLVLTAWPAIVLSTTQDHVRRMAHICHRSWVAAAMSSVQVVAVAAAVVALSGLGPQWVPFGALIFANGVSTLFGYLRLAPRRAARPGMDQLELSSIGRWLLATGVLDSLGGYLSLASIAYIAGTETVGLIEGARVIARPVQVVGLGLLAMAGPRLMEAAAVRDRTSAVRWRSLFLGVLGVTMASYAVLITIPVTRTILVSLLENGFAVPGLALASVLAHAFSVTPMPLQAEALGARRQARVARASLVGGLATVASAFTAILIGPFAGPVTHVVSGATRLGMLGREMRRIYGEPGMSIR